MASIPEFYSDYSFSTGFCGISPYIPEQNFIGDGVIMGEENFPFFGNGALNVTKPEIYTASPLLGMSYQEQLRVPAMEIVQPGLEQFHMGSEAGYKQVFSENYDGFMSDFKPFYASGVGGNSSSSTTEEEPNEKVVRYTVEERKKRILKYLKKRNSRNFNKTIKYACRKTLADRRVRVRGRFARNSELNEACQEAPAMQSNNVLCEEGCCDVGAQINLNGEDWMEEAVASLMYLPIFTDNLEELM